jgi:alpha-glucosidase
MTQSKRSVNLTMLHKVQTSLLLTILLWSGFPFFCSGCSSPRPSRLSEADGIRSLSSTYLWSFGRFSLERAATDQGAVYRWKDGERILAESLPGKAFLTGARGMEDVKESRGSFKIKDKTVLTCNSQSIDSVDSSGPELLVRGSLICEDDSRVAYQLHLKEVSAHALGFDFRVFSSDLNRLQLNLASAADEAFFGFGEQFTYFNMKGRRLPILVQEQGIGRGAQPITAGANLTAGAGGDWHTSYAGVPHFITSRMRSLFLENSEYSIFDMTEKDLIRIEVFSGRMTGRMLSGSNPAELVERYTEYSGRMRALPDWVHRGAIIGMQGGTDEVRKRLKELEAHDTPIAAFWLQDWVGQRTTSFGRQLWWNWELDQDRYPAWNELVADLRKKNIRVMTYVNPFLADVASLKGNMRRNLFAEAEKNGYLVKKADGSPYLIQNTDFHAGLLDLTNPAAVRWIKDVIKDQVLSVGASGYMADFGEALPFDAKLFSGEPASSFHNRYPEHWAALNREAAEEWKKSHPNEDIVYFVRSGYTRSPKEARLFWLGDQLVSWDEYDGIKTAVTGLLSSGLSGFAINHSDIGGYTTITHPIKNYHRSKELFLRWTEMAAFQAVFRTHEGNRPDVNHQFHSDAETLAHFARFARIYAALFSYRKTLFVEAEEHGWPVVRPLWFHYPDDPEVLNIRFESFLLGPDILVAPVLDPGVSKLSVYLPAGDWIHLWTGKSYQGRQSYSIEAAIGQPPVFVRASRTDLMAALREVAL